MEYAIEMALIAVWQLYLDTLPAGQVPQWGIRLFHVHALVWCIVGRGLADLQGSQSSLAGARHAIGDEPHSK